MGSRRPFHHEVERQFERIHFEHPIEGRLGGQKVVLLDLAIGGARVLGTVKLKPGATPELYIEWEGHPIRLKCTVTRCTIQTFVSGTSDKSTYEIGVQIMEALEGDRVIRELIAYYVIRALEEQQANWNGVPPIGPYVHVEGKSGRYRRCELFEGNWKVTPTTRPEQPINGFTVSAETPPRYLDMLCETYEKTDDEGRRLTRILAELSINKAEGVPTRRYVP